jgi:glyoxylase-like metal-dependent hydrolase (beta-lactamase superfamily II)
LHIPAHDALACADGVVHYEGSLGFVPERFMDEPEATKRRLREAYGRLLDLDFELLLLAHGAPMVGGAKQALREFVEAGADAR